MDNPGVPPISPALEVRQLAYQEKEQQNKIVAYDVIFNSKSFEKSLTLPPIGSEEALRNNKTLNININDKYSVSNNTQRKQRKAISPTLSDEELNARRKRPKSCIINHIMERKESWEKLRAEKIKNAEVRIHAVDTNKEKLRIQAKKKLKAQEERRKRAKAKVIFSSLVYFVPTFGS